MKIHASAPAAARHYVEAGRGRADDYYLIEGTGIARRHALRAQLLPRWGQYRLADVTHAEVAAWVAQFVSGGLAPATVRQARRVLALIHTLAVRDGRIPPSGTPPRACWWPVARTSRRSSGCWVTPRRR